MKIRNYLAIAGIGLATIALAGCGKDASGATGNGKYAKDQSLNWTVNGALATSDTSKATDTLSFTVLMNTQEGIYRLDKNGKPQLALAKSVKISKDGTQYDVDLKPHTKWSNGDELTAKDFVYSWQRTVNPKTASQNAFYLFQIKNAEEINSGKKPLSSLGVKATSKYHLTINLTRPVAYFKQLLAWPLFYAQNERAVKKYGSRYGTASQYIVSNGPYKLTKWTGTNKSWSLVKNKTYWDHQNVRLNKIDELVTEDTTSSYNLFNSNKTDQTALTGQQVKSNLNNKNYVKRLPTASGRVDFNLHKVKAFKNLNIRKAFSLAINRDQLVNKVLQDGSIAAKGFVPAKMGNNPKTGQAFNEEAYVKSGVGYDLAAAKKLIKQGYKETGVKKIDITLSASDTDSGKSTAEFVQSELEKLPGVKISIATIPYVQLIAKQAAKDYDITLKNWQSVFADPINFLDIYESDSSYNSSGWKSAKFDQLLDEAENQDGAKPEQRWDKLVAAEKLLLKDQATIPLFQQANSQLVRTNVKNVVFNPAGVPYDFKTTYIAAK